MINSKKIDLIAVLVIGEILSTFSRKVQFQFHIYSIFVFVSCVLFLPNTDIASYTDDKYYEIQKHIREVLTFFQNNSLEANRKKFHLLLSDTGCQGKDAYEKLLGTTFSRP